ncbi:exosortase A-associated hydrolase 1 [Novosphingobium chloroacetimidivorans]|uniref:Exosortase A-associated hydrolase 1 n=1 Tax=Novosphingobium chloroacetimidivorans TaxID=1428314 RepID=A0A7W7K9L2_9SPHN|nr:hydrolase 1, exosortase A system-associated [Novosphingobium chloroacetimidivorans]MBB4858510.1 exosortase A-associated hydrolase 1 [Novosphingobium chloroacetimidivorans]
MRRHFAFPCEGVQLVATLDEAPGCAGLLLVTGGNEVRSGAWAGQAQFAAQVAAAGHPVLRFDRRGCGDSEGVNGEFRASGPDMSAALAAMREHCPHLTRVVGMGNCDAASALMLARGAGCDGLILSNPWTFESDAADEAPPQAVRSHYRGRLKDLGAIKRLLTGKVAIAPLLKSLLSAAKPAPAPSTLAQDMAAGIAGFAGPVRYLVADRDRTGQAFAAVWTDATAIRRCPGATHSFVEADARAWLLDETLTLLSDLA